MNSGAMIFDDRETLELLRDRPDLLAIADAVRATHRRTGARRRGWLLLAAAAVLVASAAAVIALPRGGAHPPTGVTTGGAVLLMPDPVPVSQAVNDAAKEFGAPVILPNLPFLDWSADTAEASENWSPSAYPGGPTHLQQVWVQDRPTGASFVSIGYAPATDQEPTYSPALIQVGPNADNVQFRQGGLSIWIFTTGDVATLKALAQSIIDQAATAGG
jgi:hypothetical protein